MPLWGRQSLLGSGVISTASAAWSVLLALVTTPLLINGLGLSAFGVYSLAFSVVGLGAYLDLGLGWTSSKFVAEADARGDAALVATTIRASLLYHVFIGGLVLLAAIPAARWIAETVLRFTGEDAADMQALLAIAAVSFVASSVSGVFVSALRGVGRFAVATVVATCSMSLSVGLAAAAAAFGLGPRPAAIGQLAGVLIGLAGAYLACHRLMLPTTRGAAVRQMRRMMSFSLWNFGNRLCQAMVFHVDKIVVGRLAGAGALPFYVVPMSLAQRVNFFGGPAVTAIYPAAAAGQFHRDAFLVRYSLASRIVHVLTAAVASVLIFSGDRFLAAWVNPQMGISGGPFLVLFAIGYWLLAVGSFDGACVEGWNRPQWTAGAVFSSLIIGTLVTIALIPQRGSAEAVAIGVTVWLAGTGVGQMIAWYALARYDVRRFLLRTVLPVTEILVLAALLGRFLLPSVSARLFVMMAVPLMMAVLAAYGVLRVLTHEERRGLLARVLGWFAARRSRTLSASDTDASAATPAVPHNGA